MILNARENEMAENYYGLTDTGKVRSNNEDTFIAQTLDHDDLIIAGVIDGVGGYSGGEVAAAIARDTITANIKRSASDYIPVVINAFELANEKIFNERSKDKTHDSMACVCTLVIADISQNKLHYAHVGDTRLYLFRDGSLVKLSSDHSFVGFLEDSGRLTEEAAMGHPKRNEINKALGFEPNIKDQQNYIETGESPFLPGDLLLLCSDGLTDMVNKQDITNILEAKTTLQDRAKNLIDLANHHGGHDNVTVVLVKNNKVSVQQQAIMPMVEQKKSIDHVEEPVLRTKAASEPQPEVTPRTKNHGGLIALLSILCLLFLGSTIWFYLKGKPVAANAVTPVKDSVTTIKPDSLQQKLMQVINGAKKDTVLLSDSLFNKPVLINSSINIDRDTLYIKAKGNIVLKADSGFNKPGFILSPKAKVIILDHISFEGFDTGITSYNNSLIIKQVRFNNCKIPVQVSLLPPANQAVTGWLPSNIFKTDSLPKQMHHN